MQDGWSKAQRGLEFAINFMRNNAGIEDESLLSSPLLLLPIAYFSQRKDEQLTREDERQLRYWLYAANARGRYSRGSSETLLDQDLSVITKGGGPNDLTESVRQQFGRISFEPQEFAGRGPQSSLFSLVFLALRSQGAKDWRSGMSIALSNVGRAHYIQFHHIFPKSLLRGHHESKWINEIANMAFIGGRTNRSISNKEPTEYIPDIIASQGIESLMRQCVPTDPALRELDKFPEFLEARRLLLATCVNEFLQSALKS